MKPFGHVDEDGNICTQHAANEDAILTLATIGSRVATFNHDLASKLQGAMMALDEIEELLVQVGRPELSRATATAQQSLKEASSLLSASRSLTRSSTKTKVELRALVHAAGGNAQVEVRGEVPDGEIEAVVPLLAQGLGVALDALAGSGRGRSIDVIASRDGARASLVFVSSAQPTKSLGDALVLAAFVIARENGELHCGRDHRLYVQLPLVR